MPPCETPQMTRPMEVAQYSWEEIKKHDQEHDAWVVLDGGVFNVTAFMKDHPGGSSIVLPHLGEDITEVFEDEDHHRHSVSAHNILQRYKIGALEGAQRDGTQSAQRKGTTQSRMDIDWTKPIVFQVGVLGDQYDSFVHDPKVLDEPARFFESDFLEQFSRTSWYVIPTVWLPVIAGMVVYCVAKLGMTVPCATFTFICGVFLWSLIEYTLHRFLFHLDEAVQFNYWTITLHFLVHGVHHKLPQDPMRLVFPPVLTCVLLAPIYLFFRSFLATPEAIVVTAGGLLGYVAYDLTHYYLHHSGIPPLSYLGQLKKYHLAHHYKNPRLGYGITSKTWDYVFGTVLPMEDKAVKRAKAT